MRSARYAGMFYPNDPDELKDMIDGFLKNVDHKRNSIDGELKAIIVPHAGYVFSGQTAAYAYDLVPKTTRRVFLIGPSHYIPNPGIASSSTDWQTPLGSVKIKPLENDLVRIDDLPHEKEHSLEVQLPFLQYVLGSDIEVTMLAVNETDVKSAAQMLNGLLNKDTLLVVSTDLSHFYDERAAWQLDGKTSEDIVSKKSASLPYDEACGLEGIKIVVELASMNDWTIKELDRSTSAKTTGDRRRVVGYGSFAVFK
ncbi:MAG: AmmeMemoRadiSam system protein B [Candidatus Woesearchaeota archaeon]